MQFQTALEIIRIVPVILILVYAAICDHKTGHAPNRTWMYMPTGLFLTALTVLIYPQTLTLTVISILATVGLSLALFYCRMWGGADAKALIFIALCMPLTSFGGVTMILPLTVMVLAGPIAIAYTVFKQPKNLLHAKIRYLPFIFAAFVLTVLIF